MEPAQSDVVETRAVGALLDDAQSADTQFDYAALFGDLQLTADASPAGMQPADDSRTDDASPFDNYESCIDMLIDNMQHTGNMTRTEAYHAVMQLADKTRSDEELAAETPFVDAAAPDKKASGGKRIPVLPSPANVDLVEAASCGDEERARAAKESGADDFDEMLAAAAVGGHVRLVHLARKWGAMNCVRLLMIAARHGHEELVSMAHEWLDGCRDGRQCSASAKGCGRFKRCDLMLTEATLGGCTRLVHLALDRGATNVDAMLGCAASGGHEQLARLARDRGARDYDHMLLMAARFGHDELVRLAREWGGRNYDAATMVAAEWGHEKTAQMIRQWTAEQ